MRPTFLLFAIASALIATYLVCPRGAVASERERLDNRWRFHLGDVDSAHEPDFDDRGWGAVDLPHDWSIHEAPTADAPSSGAGGYHSTGVGWYRRELPIDPSESSLFYTLEFEGVYQNAEVWLNGIKLGDYSYGYTPFSFDISQRLLPGGKNMLAVRVDNSAQPNCRWYSGSGIYRHVWLRKQGAVSIVPNSLWLRTHSLSTSVAEVEASLEVVNRQSQTANLEARVSLMDANGKVVAKGLRDMLIGANKEQSVEIPFAVSNPRPWSPEEPVLYSMRVEIVEKTGAGIVLDTLRKSCGIRTISVDAERGMQLNGQSIVMYGGNVHHDHGLLGAASFDDAERRRAQLLKQAGFNAVRTAHNPPAEAFLDACDELGLLVVDEAFDGWEKQKTDYDYGDRFADQWRQILSSMVLRDRHHPCVIMWSIGNEMYERGDKRGQWYARELADHVRSLDDTRPVTAGVNGLGSRPWSELDPLFNPLDVAGYNYESARFEDDHERTPERVMMTSESYPTAAMESWQSVTNQPWVIGDFVWSAIDYLGEAGIGRVFPPGAEVLPHWEGEHFPWRGAACGDIDLLGFRKPVSYHRNIVWNRGEMLALAVERPVEGDAWGLSPWATTPSEASWTWPVEPGTPLKVDVFSRWPRVRLLLNGKSLGERPTGEKQGFSAEFVAPYEPGRLTAIGLGPGKMQQTTLTTAGEVVGTLLRPHVKQTTADRQQIVFVDAMIIDAEGRLNPQADMPVQFSVEGPAEIIAVGNADLTSRHSYRGDTCSTHQGRCQAILRSTGEIGQAKLTAITKGMPDASAVIEFVSGK